MRTIAVAIDKDVITLRFYIDRPPTELDIKDAEYICNKLEKLLVEAQSEIEIARHMCLFSDLPKGKIDTFDGSIYSRNEDTWVDSDPW